jgi:hypothetical protein
MVRKSACWVLVVSSVLAATAFFAPAASAAKSNKAFCDAVSNISDRVESSDITDLGDVKATANALKDAGKQAPKKVRSAMNTMAGFYSSLAGLSKGQAAIEAVKHAKSYTKAVGTFTSYYVKTCVSVPTTTSGDNGSTT